MYDMYILQIQAVHNQSRLPYNKVRIYVLVLQKYSTCINMVLLLSVKNIRYLFSNKKGYQIKYIIKKKKTVQKVIWKKKRFFKSYVTMYHDDNDIFFLKNFVFISKGTSPSQSQGLSGSRPPLHTSLEPAPKLISCIFFFFFKKKG